MKTQLQKRIESFIWRFGMAVIAFSLDYLAQNLGILELPGEMVLVLALVLGEVSKAINNKLQEKKSGI